MRTSWGISWGRLFGGCCGGGGACGPAGGLSSSLSLMTGARRARAMRPTAGWEALGFVCTEYFQESQFDNARDQTGPHTNEQMYAPARRCSAAGKQPGRRGCGCGSGLFAGRGHQHIESSHNMHTHERIECGTASRTLQLRARQEGLGGVEAEDVADVGLELAVLLVIADVVDDGVDGGPLLLVQLLPGHQLDQHAEHQPVGDPHG